VALRIADVETAIRLDVGESQRNTTLQWAQGIPHLQQTVHRNGAADFVAMHQRQNHHVRTGDTAVDTVDEIHAGITVLPFGDIRKFNLQRIVLQLCAYLFQGFHTIAPTFRHPTSANARGRKRAEYLV